MVGVKAIVSRACPLGGSSARASRLVAGDPSWFRFQVQFSWVKPNMGEKHGHFSLNERA